MREPVSLRGDDKEHKERTHPSGKKHVYDRVEQAADAGDTGQVRSVDKRDLVEAGCDRVS